MKNKFDTIDTLINRLYYYFTNHEKIIFLFGSGLTLPTKDRKGVPGTSKIYEFVENHVKQLFGSNEYNKFKDYIKRESSSSNRKYIDKYEFAFEWLESNAGLTKCNHVITYSVLQARKIENEISDLKKQNSKLKEFDNDLVGWDLAPGLETFGKVAYLYRSSLKNILTTNFDPLIEITCRRNNVDTNSICFEKDGNFDNFISENINVIHLHGYWRSYDTINTKRKIESASEQWRNLKSNLKAIIEESSILVVIGYGGWQDIISQSLIEILKENKKINILWTFYEKNKKTIEKKYEYILKNLERFFPTRFYKYLSIDCNILFPRLLKRLLLEDIYTDYLKEIKEKIDKDESPHEFDEKLTIYSLDFDSINYTRDGKWDINNLYKSDIISHIKKTIRNKSIICTSFYGMGKTTITRALFCSLITKNQGLKPILIDLNGKDLSMFTKKDNFLHYLSNKVFKGISSGFSNDILENILFIFDSIEESYGNNKYSIKNFLNILYDLQITYFLTARKEFHTFFDALDEIETKLNFEIIELKPWGTNQWEKYINCIKKSDKYKGQDNKIIRLSKKLKFNKYGDLPQNSLLLKMITDINFNKKEVNIVDKLSNNKAEIYYKFIKLKILNEINGNSELNVRVKISKSKYLAESFLLLKELAYIISNKIQSSSIRILEKIDWKSTNEEDIKLTRLDILEIFQKYKYFEILNPSIVIGLLDGFGKFVILKKIFENKYKFTHYSFIEYLIGYFLAEGIFDKNEPYCSKAWDLYQTDEISEHFVEEIERNEITYRIEAKGLMNKSFEHSIYGWPKIGNKFTYSEKREEILFYTGKFQLNNVEIMNRLNDIFSSKKEREKYPPVYYRTAAISLSKLKKNGEKYMFKFLEFLIEDYKEGRKYFTENIRIDNEYYGSVELKVKAHESLARIIKSLGSKSTTPKIDTKDLLKMFSYFISTSTPNEAFLKCKLEKLNKLKEISKKINNLGLFYLSHGIEFILCDQYNDNILYPNIENKYSKVEIEKKLEAALELRKNTLNEETNIFRLINSLSDKLPGLFIDIYGSIAVLQYQRKTILEYEKIIQDWLMEKLHIKDIYSKSDNWRAKQRNIQFEKIKTEPFKASEYGITYLIDPSMSKTGFFIDLRGVRKKIPEFINKDSIVLNLFSFTCALSVVAQKNGAKKVINVDKSKKVLELGKNIYKINGIPINDTEFLNLNVDNIFNNEKKCVPEAKSILSQRYDLIILDPPEFNVIPHKLREWEKVYKNINKKSLHLLKKNGVLITSCCSHGFKNKLFESLIFQIINNSNNRYEIIWRDGTNRKTNLIDHYSKTNETLDYLRIFAIRKIC